MDRLHQMMVFTAVADEQSFAGGARRMRMSAPAVTRAVAALEASLKVRLLTRTTRYVRVTPAGKRYLDDARRIIADVVAADESVRGHNAKPTGQLTVTAPVIFGRLHVMPAITKYLASYPDTSIVALFDDRVIGMLEEGIDVGVRIGELPDSTHHAVRVGSVRRVLCATPRYLKANGTPQTPADLANSFIIAAATVSTNTEWSFASGRATSAIRVKPRLTVSNNDAAIVACLSGIGITRLLSYQITDLIRSGQLRIVLEEFETKAIPVHVVYREGRQASATTRAFVDIVVESIKSALS
jgi:DNA-binding transcriptional LysR family regulator